MNRIFRLALFAFLFAGAYAATTALRSAAQPDPTLRALLQETPPAPAAPEATAVQDPTAVVDSVAAEVEELRGWKFKEPVKKKVYTEEQLRAYVKRKLFEEEYPGDALPHLEAFLTMVGIIPPDTPLEKTVVDLLLNQVGGFYDPETRAFYMIDRKDTDYGPAMEKILIAHELTHALDDQHLDLQALIDLREHTEDNEFAIGSVVEGSATVLMTRYMTKMQLEGRLDMSEMMDLVKSEQERSKVFLEAPLYFRTLLARYSVGMSFLLKGKLTALLDPDIGPRVAENLEAAVKDPPRSSEQILHAEKYWEERDEPVTVDDDAVKEILAGTGFRVAAVNTGGEIGAAIVTTPADAPLNLASMGSPGAWTTAAATGWGGDRFFLLEPEVLERGAPENTYRGLWLTMWDTPEDREEFVNAYRATVADPGRRAVRMGDRTSAFLYGMSPGEAEKVEAALTGKPLPFMKGEDNWE